MDALFRLHGAKRNNQAVDTWLAKQAPELGALALVWLARMRKCGRDVRDVMHDGCPTACVHDAAFAYVGVFTKHINVGFFHGADLHDPQGLLLGGGRRMRHVKVTPGVEFAEDALDALIRDAYADIRRRLETEGNAKAGRLPRNRVGRARPGRVNLRETAGFCV